MSVGSPAEVWQRVTYTLQALRQECRGLHPNTYDRRPLVGRSMESIAVTHVRFKPIRDNDVARTDLIPWASRFVAKDFGEQLQIADDGVLKGRAGERECP